MPLKKPSKEKPLDAIDLRILELLQQDSNLSVKEVAGKLRMTTTPVHLRIKRLWDEGYIRRYTALLDPAKVGLELIAYTQVTLKEHTQEALLAFQSQVVKLTEVMECYHMNGNFDFLLRIAISDMKAYSEVLMAKLSKLPDVGTMNTYFVMSEVKYETAYTLNFSK